MRPALIAIAVALLLSGGLPLSAEPALAATRGPIPDDLWQQMQGKSWHPDRSCPARNALSLVTVPYLDFAGQPQMGHLIVARGEADRVAAIFTEIFATKKFRIERMEPIDAFNGDDDASMAANNTSAFNCRRTTGGTVSMHAAGAAIDINPVQNPYVTKTETAPPAGRAFDESSKRLPTVTGIITAGDVVTKAFERHGWKWGGNWTRSKDYQHFSKSGR